MTSYTEYVLQKSAAGETNYQKVQKALESGNQTVANAMSRVSPQELLWSAIGAGLGAGGSYFLSKKLRRNGTRNQRALDILIGALAGAGIVNVGMSGLQDSKSGLTARQQMRADRYLEENGLGDGESLNDAAPRVAENPYGPNEHTITGAALGVVPGMLGGHWLGQLEPALENVARSRATAKVTAEALKLGPTGSPAYNKHLYSNSAQTSINRAAARGSRIGHGLDVGIGGALGAGTGWLIGGKIHKNTMDRALANGTALV